MRNKKRMDDELEKNIRDLFNSGYSYNEMLVILELRQGVSISYRQLKRHCKSLGLKRRSNWDTAVIQAAILAEVQGTGRNLGCRAMVSKLRTKYGLNVGREKVLEYQNLIDPEGVQARLSNRLSRREYFNKGPNYLIHIDGYDKIKKYGFGIHGAICGFSRRILWLRVAHSNNNPNIIAAYFLDFVKTLKGAPRCIRMDAGTENVVVADMQKALRWYHGDSTSGERSVIVGSSHTNQRIECWWRQLHQRSIAAWKDKFCQMEEQGFFSTADNIHILCVRFCFMKLIQEELDMVCEEWNTHYIRRQTREGSPCGKPDMLYLHPELYGTYDYKFPVQDADCETLSTYCDIPHVNGIEEELEATLLQLMHLHGKHMPETSAEANDLLVWLTSKLQ